MAELRAAGTSEEQAVRQINVSQYVDPYTNEPFTWIDGEDAVLFDGLQRQEARSRHTLIF